MTLVSNGPGNFVPYRFTYADAAARTGDTGLAAGDVGSLALQLDNGTLWRLTATTPTWASVAPVTAHTHAAADVTSGTIATARLGSGTADATTFLRGDQSWATPAGGSALTVEEVDGSPTDSAVTKIVFPNGTLGIASHIVTYTPSGTGVGTVPVFMADKGGTDQTGVAASTWTKVTWPTEVLDTQGNFASDRFTPLTSGEYLLVAQLWWTAPGSNMYTAIYKNGSLHKQATAQPVIGSDLSVPCTALVQANGSTDYFEVYCFQSNGTRTLEGDADKSWFHGYKVVR